MRRCWDAVPGDTFQAADMGVVSVAGLMNGEAVVLQIHAAGPAEGIIIP